jgi:hypothetical protein
MGKVRIIREQETKGTSVGNAPAVAAAAGPSFGREAASMGLFVGSMVIGIPAMVAGIRGVNRWIPDKRIKIKEDVLLKMAKDVEAEMKAEADQSKKEKEKVVDMSNGAEKS